MNTNLCFKMARHEQRMAAQAFDVARSARARGDRPDASKWRRWGYQSRGLYTFWVDQIAQATGRDAKKVFAYFRLTQGVSHEL